MPRSASSPRPWRLSTRVSSLADWMMDSMSDIFGWIGATREALKSVAQPLALTDRPDAEASETHRRRHQLR